MVSNYKTEEQARKMWCPMARCSASIGGEEAPASNRYVHESINNPKECRCIASACAMWRWWDDQHGYCGLGGRMSGNGFRN